MLRAAVRWPTYVVPLGLYRSLVTSSGWSFAASAPTSDRWAIGPASISRRSRRFSIALVCTSISPARCTAATCSICDFTSLSLAAESECPGSASGLASVKLTVLATIS